jgi:hypothetical protein
MEVEAKPYLMLWPGDHPKGQDGWENPGKEGFVSTAPKYERPLVLVQQLGNRLRVEAGKERKLLLKCDAQISSVPSPGH